MRREVRRQRAAPVVALPKRDDLAAARVDLREREGGLDRLRATVGEERLGETARGDGRELLGGPGVYLRAVQRRRVSEATRLVLDRLDDPRMAVAHRGRQDAREGVQILLAVHVGHPDALAMVHDHGLLVQRPHGRENVLGVQREDFGAPRLCQRITHG